MKVELKNIGKKYEGREEFTIRNINVEIESKDFCIILGPSGCGKSTLLRMIAGLNSITEGELLFNGKLMNKVASKDRNIAMVFQSYALYPHMTVYDNMAFSLAMRKMDKRIIHERVLEAAKILQIEKYLYSKPSDISGGQRQRVAMGRAIVRNPKVFLMDEPLSNLDAKLRVQMRIEISKLHQKLGTTMIYVTHDQTEAMTLGTRIVVMKDGVVQQIDTPQNLYDHPRNLFVAGFIGSPQINLIDVEVLKEDDGIYVKNDYIKLKLPEEKGRVLEEKNYIGKKVVFGIRPESLYDDENYLEKTEKESIVEAKIRVYELMGAEVYLYFDLGDDQITARVKPSTKAKVGEKRKFALDMEKTYLFDKETSLIIE